MREAFQPAAKVVSVDEVSEMASQLVTIFVMITFDGCAFDRAARALDPSIRPRMVDLGEAMLDPILREC
ncbi:hypothetical protein DSM21852_42670 (plasmid) [Methylocystis bryophila]|nr:hypothetical protein DSM21852_42670 [Methylocystis bryophila]